MLAAMSRVATRQAHPLLPLAPLPLHTALCLWLKRDQMTTVMLPALVANRTVPVAPHCLRLARKWPCCEFRMLHEIVPAGKQWAARLPFCCTTSATTTVSMPLSQFLGREQGDGAELKPQVRRRHTAGEQQRAAGLRRAVSPRHAVRRRQQRRCDASAGIGERSWYECRPHLHCTARCWSCGRGGRAALRLPTGLAGRAQRHGVSLSCGHVRGQAGGGCVHGAGDLRRW